MCVCAKCVVCVGTPVRALVTSRLGLIELSSSRGLGQQIGTVKCRFLLGRNETEVKATTEAHLTLTSVDTMEQQKRTRDGYESDLITFMRMGSISILDALAVKLPDVFTAEILPKLDIEDTLNLAQVSKTYRDSVWSVGGVRSMEAKMEAHMKNHRMTRATHPMLDAAWYGNLPAVRALLESGVDANKSLTKGRTTALILAAGQGHVAIVKLLIEKGADPNIKHFTRGATALYMAAEHSNPVCVMELIKAGADVNLADNYGHTPLMVAADRGHDRHDIIAGLLINSGADVHRVDDDGNTALSLAEAIAAIDFEVDPDSRRYIIHAMLKGTDHLKVHSV